MFERFTDSARDVVVGAQHEARTPGHDHIGTEHLLLAILHSEDTVAARAIVSLTGSAESVRQQVEATTGRGQGSPDTHIPFTPRGKKTLELALRAAPHHDDRHQRRVHPPRHRAFPRKRLEISLMVLFWPGRGSPVRLGRSWIDDLPQSRNHRPSSCFFVQQVVQGAIQGIFRNPAG